MLKYSLKIEKCLVNAFNFYIRRVMNIILNSFFKKWDHCFHSHVLRNQNNGQRVPLTWLRSVGAPPKSLRSRPRASLKALTSWVKATMSSCSTIRHPPAFPLPEWALLPPGIIPDEVGPPEGPAWPVSELMLPTDPSEETLAKETDLEPDAEPLPPEFFKEEVAILSIDCIGSGSPPLIKCGTWIFLRKFEINYLGIFLKNIFQHSAE